MDKKDEKISKKKSIWIPVWSWVFSLGNSIGSLRDFQITKDTFYNIQEMSTEAQAFKEKIIHWIGKNWLYIEKNWEEYQNDIELQKVQDTFKDKTRLSFKDKYFTNHFASGDIYMYWAENALWEKRCQIVDSRTMVKKLDNNFNIVWYQQYTVWQAKDIPFDDVYNSIVRYNPLKPLYWKSLYQGILYDALSDSESAKRQFYFFKNSWIPNALIMLEDNMTNKETIQNVKDQIKEKYQWTENAHKVMIWQGIKDVKILELSNKDLDLLNLRNFIVKKRGVVFQIDPRIIGFMMDSWADRSINSIREEAKETINNLSKQFEDDINNFYKEFVNSKMDFRIVVDSEQFNDRDKIESAQREDVVLWLLTMNEVREERWKEKYTIPEADEPMVWWNMTFVSDLKNSNPFTATPVVDEPIKE